MRVGEMMVVVRAQDFASRTLRRVGTEFSHLSRAEQIAARRGQIAFQKMNAAAQVEDALRNQRGLQMVDRYNQALTTQAARYRDLAAAQKHLDNLRSGRSVAIQRAHQEIAMARQELDFFRQARQLGVSRKTLSPGARVAGMEQATQRLARAHDALATASRNDIQAHTDAERAVSRARSRYAQAARSVDNYANSVKQLPGWLRAAATSQFAYEGALSRSNRELRAAYNNLSKAQQAEVAFNSALRQMPAQRMHEFGQAMSGIGRTMQLFGAITTASFGFAAASAAEFSTSISLAATQARDIGGTADQIGVRIDQLTNGFDQNGRHIDGVLDLMNRYPATAEEMSASAYDIFSSMQLQDNGITNVAKGLGLLERANQIAVAGGGSLEEATSAMITVLNNFDPKLQRTTETFDTMFDIVRFGRMRMADFNIMMNKIAPAAADAGNELEDVGGAMAFLTQVMPSQRMVATGISRLLEALRHPDVVAGLQKLGVEVKDATGRLKPLDEILETLAQRFPQLATGQKSAAEFFRQVSAIGRGSGRGQIFTQEGRRALSEILTHFDQYMEAQTQIENNQNEFATAQEAQMKTIGIQWGIFKNQVRAVAITIGAEAVPVFAELGEILQRFLAWFRSLDQETRSQIVRFTVWASVGTLLGGVLLAVVGSITSLLASLRLLSITGGGSLTTLVGIQSILSKLAGIGAIALILKTAWTGDATAKDFLMGAVLGGAFGARFGPAGIVLGAITVPIIMKVVMDQRNVDPQREAFAQYKRDFRDAHVESQGFFDGVLEGLQAIKDSKGLSLITGATPEGQKSFREFNKFQKQSNANRKEALSLVNDKILMREAAAQGNNTKEKTKAKTAAQKYKDALQKMYEELNKGDEKIKQHKDAMAQWRKELALATTQARKDAISSLRSLYSEIEQENRSAFGQLFQGPWLTGEAFNLAEEWGIEPRIQDLIRDLNEQNTQFSTWRRSLDKVLARGLPTEFVDELRAMGPEEGQAILDQIIGATPAQVQRLIGEWKRKNAQIKQATKMDFTAEIQQFRKAGGNMGQAIIDGFRNAGVGPWFDAWIKTTFPGLINQAVNQAVNEWKQTNPAPTNTNKPKPLPKHVRPGAGGNTQTNTDNSKSVTVNINMSPDAKDANDDAKIRRAALIAANKARELLR